MEYKIHLHNSVPNQIKISILKIRIPSLGSNFLANPISTCMMLNLFII